MEIYIVRIFLESSKNPLEAKCFSFILKNYVFKALNVKNNRFIFSNNRYYIKNIL